jgi:hypothetical protein
MQLIIQELLDTWRGRIGIESSKFSIAFTVESKWAIICVRGKTE